MISGTAQAIEGEARVWTEGEMKKMNGVRFIRMGNNETLVFTVDAYLGPHRLINERYGNPYNAHIWKVRFHRANNVDYRVPLPGLLQIKDWIWDQYFKTNEPKELGADGALLKITFRTTLIVGLATITPRVVGADKQ